MFEFQNPIVFIFLLFIPLFFVLRKLRLFRQVSFWAVLSDWNGSNFEWKGYINKFLQIFSTVLLFIGFIFVIIAYADPVKTYQEKVYTSLGTDIFFVVDTSPSMAARDMDGETRLQASKNAILELIEKNDGYRYGIVVLGDGASVLVPPTNDMDVFEKQLENIKVGMLGNGSAIGDGLSTAVCHLVSSSAPKKCIILLTDGENNAGEIHPDTAATLAFERNISIYVIGIGTKGSVPIDYVDPNTQKTYSGYLESDYNTTQLKNIASMAQGKFYETKSLSEFSSLLNVIAKEESVIQNYTYKSISKPLYKFFLFISIIVFVVATFIRFVLLKGFYQFKLRKILILRFVCMLLAFIMLVLAYMGFSWGTYLYPVQKNGNAVAFVFDISNSMLAQDGPNGSTRLQSVKDYSARLLERMSNVPVSVVLVKGEGQGVIPITQDYAMIHSLIDVLNPKLMTAAGTSLGSGILCAKKTFPINYSNACKIWVFTDGEETDDLLIGSLRECVKSGISVSIIGFGSESGAEVLAGDGKTKVYSCLQNQFIMQTILELQEEYSFYNKNFPIYYYNSMERASALKLLNQLNTTYSEKQIITYEAKSILRYKLFITIALVLFLMGIFFAEFDFARFFGNKKRTSLTLGLSIFVLMTGCSFPTMQNLEGTYKWQQKNYKKAIANFIQIGTNAKLHNNQEILDYSLYNLGTSYLMLQENTAALEQFSKISENADKKVLYAAFYNSGIIAYQNEQYDQAQEYFKNALKVDNTKLDAKINLELSIKMVQVATHDNQSKINPTSENENNPMDMENTVFEHIRENDKKQWKNSQDTTVQNLSEDY